MAHAVTPALRQRKEDLKFQASLGYPVRYHLKNKQQKPDSGTEAVSLSFLPRGKPGYVAPILCAIWVGVHPGTGDLTLPFPLSSGLLSDWPGQRPDPSNLVVNIV